jgi:hypothetical protein
MKSKINFYLKTHQQFIDAVDWMEEGDGEPGWMIYLKPGWSFDPGSNDGSRFMPANTAGQEFKNLIIYSVEA